MIPNLAVDPSTILLAAGLILLMGVLAAARRAWVRDPVRALDAYLGQHEAGADPARVAAVASTHHKARLAFQRFKIDVSGRERFYLVVLYLILVVVIYPVLAAVLRLPPGIAGVGALISAGFVEQAILASAWDRMRREIEQDIPTLMIRLSGMIQASPNVLESLDEVAQSLDLERPLHHWISRLVTETQARGIAAFEEMEQEAEVISLTLILAVVQIRRLWESGGSGYVDSFRLIATHLSELMNTRAMAYAKSGRSGNLARIIMVSAAFSLTMILRNPTTRGLFLANPVATAGLMLFFAWAGFGWFYIRSILRSVTT